MIVISHPFGNEFARAVLAGLERDGRLHSFHTTLAFRESDWVARFAPPALRQELLRRRYDCQRSKIVTRPWKEFVRLAASRFGWSVLTTHERGWASVDSVCQDLDRSVADYLTNCLSDEVKGERKAISAAYCYEDAAFHTFQAAKQFGVKCIYDLPIAYWQTVQRLLSEESQRLPEWEPTLGGTRDSREKLGRKSEELAMADLVICPSKFVYNSLPERIRNERAAIVAEFGSPPPVVPAERSKNANGNRPLRVLFAGAMTQRKGLADLFSAWKMLNRSDVELIVMGSPVAPMSFYKEQLQQFVHEPPRPHDEVLQLMQSCDIFVLPSIVEGRALVQQEAMICGLPLIVTANAGGEDLIEEGKTGFLVPIRSAEKIAEKINWFAENRDCLEEMSNASRRKAAQITWRTYRQKILSAIETLVSKGRE